MVIHLQHSADAMYHYTSVSMGESDKNTVPTGDLEFENYEEWKLFNDVLRAGVRDIGEVELIEDGQEEIEDEARREAEMAGSGSGILNTDDEEDYP